MIDGQDLRLQRSCTTRKREERPDGLGHGTSRLQCPRVRLACVLVLPTLEKRFALLFSAGGRRCICGTALRTALPRHMNVDCGRDV